jgi:hypothetical protein
MSAVLSAQRGNRDAVVAWLLEPDDPAVVIQPDDSAAPAQDDPEVIAARSS